MNKLKPHFKDKFYIMGAAMSATINTISQEAYGALEVYRN